MVMRQVGVMMALGWASGWSRRLALGRAASSLLYGLQGHDPVVFLLGVLVLGLRGARGGLPPGPAGLAGRSDAGAAVRIAP